MRNSQELDAAARGWAAQAKADIQNQLNDFKRKTRMSDSDVAAMLGMRNGDIHNFLNSGAIETFAKLLIASGNVLEIKPLEEAMKNGFAPTPTNGRAPMPPRFGREGSMPPPPPHFGHGNAPTPPPFYPMPTANEDDGEKFDEFYDDPDPYSELNREEQEFVDSVLINRASRADMIDFIYDKGLDGEIDCLRASDDELADFIKGEFSSDGQEATEEQDNSYNSFLDMLKEEIDKHPSLKRSVSDIVNG